MDRQQTLELLRATLPGRNLYELAQSHAVTIRKQGRLNKGWVGQVVEKMAACEAGNAQRRDGVDFELKSTSLIKSSADAGGWIPKETIKVTQLSPEAMLTETFESSSLWDKLQRLILVGCHHESEEICRVVAIDAVDIDDPELVAGIRSFWEEVRYNLCSGELPEIPNLGTSEGYLQLRPTGTGKNFSRCPVTGRLFPARAFYATKRLIREIFDGPGAEFRQPFFGAHPSADGNYRR